MAASFTGPQKAAIRQYLGFSELYLQTDTRLESQLDALPASSPDAADRIIATLARLAALDARLCRATGQLSVAAIGDITLRGEPGMDALANQGRRYIQQLAVTFDVVPPRDYYGAGEAGGVLALG